MKERMEATSTLSAINMPHRIYIVEQMNVLEVILSNCETPNYHSNNSGGH